MNKNQPMYIGVVFAKRGFRHNDGQLMTMFSPHQDYIDEDVVVVCCISTLVRVVAWLAYLIILNIYCKYMLFPKKVKGLGKEKQYFTRKLQKIAPFYF